jgi:hypothetical protein
MKWDGYPNLRMRPPAPAEGRGRIQIRIRRAFTASGAEALTSSQIYDWTHVRRRQRDKTLPAGTYSRTTRTLRAMCEPVGRGTSRGRPILWRLRNSGGAIDAALSRPAPPCGVGKMAKRKMLFHPDYLREKIRASKLINRLQKYAFGEISLTTTQLRAIEILLRKCIPDLAAAEIETEQTHRYVVEIPAVLTREQWLEKYGKCDKESDLPDKPDRPLH